MTDLKTDLKQTKTLNAFYLLRSKEAQSLTQKALDDVVEGSTSLVRNTVELIKLGVQNRLDSAGIDFKAVPGLSELCAEDPGGGGGGTWVFFGWVCAARDSKLAPRSKKNFP